jgi:hypothetical protein
LRIGFVRKIHLTFTKYATERYPSPPMIAELLIPLLSKTNGVRD